MNVESLIRILHVDDNPDDLELIEFQLKRLSVDLDIHFAESAQEALSLLSETSFDCVLCDFQMPGSDGLEFLKTLRDRGDDIPFIFLTGQGNEELAARALRAGADDYYTKETTFAHYDRLLNSIRRVVEAKAERARKTEAERALRESEERYRNLVERAHDGIVLIQDRIIRFANTSMAMMLGYTISEMVGSAFTKYVNEKEVSKLIDRYQRRIEGESVPSTYETVLQRRDSSLINVELNAGLITSGDRPADLVFVRDITERRKMEQALRESEERFRSLVENINEILFTTDMRGRVSYVSPVIERLSGFAVDEIVGRRFDSFVHPPDQSWVRANARRTLHGHPEQFECRILDKSGAVRHVLVSMSLVYREGDPVGYTGIITDIGERKRAELIRTSIYKISESIASSGNLQELFGKIHSIVAELMPAENFYIALYDPEADLIDFAYFVDQFDETPDPLPPGKTLTGYVLRTGKSLLATPEVFRELHERGEVDSIGAESIDWLGVPLMTRGSIIGVLVVQSYTEGVRYGIEEEGILSFVSGQVAMAIERKQAEEDLREKEEKYRNLFQFSSDMIFLHDLEGNILDVNQRAAEQLGYSKRELLSLKVADLHPPGALADCAVAFEQVEEKGFFRFVVPFRRSDGGTFMAEVSSSLVQVGDKKVVQGIVREINGDEAKNS